MRPCTPDKKLIEEWVVPFKSIEDIYEPETKIINEPLERINTKGFLTINSQLAEGWGGPGGYVYQKAYVEFFCSKEKLDTLVDKCKDRTSLTYMAVNKEGSWKSNVGQTDVNAMTWGVFPDKEIKQPTIVDPVSFNVWKDEAFEIWPRGWASLRVMHPGNWLKRLVGGTYFSVSLVDNDYINGDLFAVFADF
ncbi:hypothetical protein VNO80_00004 [Phaseolus coccineus]|uniref:MTHFR SAM-binding regulatory domain-containing protein n=1 Tax=Phaseolus coccineus TaxID=3886 RepID=A0AAN9NYC6_PHACN